MGKKAKQKSTTSPAAKSLPLQSPNWWPWRRAIPYVREQVAVDHVADFDLATAMNNRDVRIKIEAVDYKQTPPKRISAVLDEVNFFPYFRIRPQRGLVVVQLTPDKCMFSGAAFFAWGPDLQRIWPASTTKVDTAGSRSVLRQPSGPKTARAWQDHVLREIVRANRTGRPHPSASKLAQSCLDDLNISVETTSINKFLRDVDAG